MEGSPDEEGRVLESMLSCALERKAGLIKKECRIASELDRVVAETQESPRRA